LLSHLEKVERNLVSSYFGDEERDASDEDQLGVDEAHDDESRCPGTQERKHVANC
jgi:hypothetical protein